MVMVIWQHDGNNRKIKFEFRHFTLVVTVSLRTVVQMMSIHKEIESEMDMTRDARKFMTVSYRLTGKLPFQSYRGNL